MVGYSRYLDLVSDLTDDKELIASGMRQEKERCEAALRKAMEGAIVALVSSGDPGVYGMAGLAIELAEAHGWNVPIEVLPGVSAAQAAAACMGAPLALDYACISLSDLLVPWETIRRRLVAVAGADLVVALYNPRSSKRVARFEEAVSIFRDYRSGLTPVGLGTAVGTDEEKVVFTDLDHLLDQEVNMKTVVIIGNTTSRRRGRWFVTPRGYAIERRDEMNGEAEA